VRACREKANEGESAGVRRVHAGEKAVPRSRRREMLERARESPVNRRCAKCEQRAQATHGGSATGRWCKVPPTAGGRGRIKTPVKHTVHSSRQAAGRWAGRRRCRAGRSVYACRALRGNKPRRKVAAETKRAVAVIAQGALQEGAQVWRSACAPQRWRRYRRHPQDRQKGKPQVPPSFCLRQERKYA